MLDELAKRESEVELVEQLFTKIRNNFGETSEEERKIEQLRTIEQGGRTCDEYVQEFKKVARGSGYEERPLIKEFKRELNRSIRRNWQKQKNHQPPLEMLSIDNEYPLVITLDGCSRRTQ